jgi:hypothetical protein
MIVRVSLALGLAALLGLSAGAAAETAMEHAVRHTDPTYVCPMHPEITRQGPGECPLCGMDLVPRASEAQAGEPGPGPSHAPYPSHPPAPVVSVPSAVVSQLGVRTARVTRGTLIRPLRTVGYVTGGAYSSAVPYPTAPGAATLGVGSASVPSASAANAPAAPAADPRADPAVSGLPDETAEPPPARRVREVTIAGEVFERHLPLLTEGLEAEFRLPYLPDRSWKGTVAWVDQELDPVKRTLLFNVQVETDDERLRTHVRGDLTLYTAPASDVLLVPREAVIRTGSEARVVLALGEGRFQPRPVMIAAEGDEQVAIGSGLQEGDEVVTSAQLLLDSEASLRAGLRRLSADPLDPARPADNGTPAHSR